MQNTFKERLHNGERAIGIWLGLPSPELVELAGYAGFHFVVIDAEHYTFGWETVQDIVRAAQLTGMTPLVRAPKNDPHLILGYLETGILGVIAPHVNTAGETRRLVQAVKYPPQGERGAGSSTRAADYGFSYNSAEYFARANEQTVVIPMVEEREALENLPQILQVPGIDSIFIGQGDLSLSMGFPGNPGSPEVATLVEQAEQQIREAGLPLGALGASLASAQTAFEQGAAYFVLSSAGFLGANFEQFIAAANAR